MKKKMSDNKNIIYLVVFILVFLFILMDVFRHQVTSYDNWAYQVFVEDLRNDNLTSIMKVITSLGSAIFIGAAAALLFLLYKNKKDVYILLLNTVIIVVINDFIKFLVHRPRPIGYNLINETNYSFPSGHSMVSTFFYGFLIYLVYKEISNKTLKYLIISILALLIILICISRIYLGVHYLSDTIAGFALSMTYIMILLVYNKKHKGKKEQ